MFAVGATMTIWIGDRRDRRLADETGHVVAMQSVHVWIGVNRARSDQEFLYLWNGSNSPVLDVKVVVRSSRGGTTDGERPFHEQQILAPTPERPFRVPLDGRADGHDVRPGSVLRVDSFSFKDTDSIYWRNNSEGVLERRVGTSWVPVEPRPGFASTRGTTPRR